MAYVVKRRLFREFRQDFPQLCANTPTSAPLDFTVLKNVEEVVIKPVNSLPPGWINVRTYLRNLRTYVPSEELDVHTLMYNCVKKMRARWEKWNREHDVYVDYDHYDDGLTYDDISDTESESSYAEDPEDVWSD